MERRIWDISIPLTESIAVWPGDVPLNFESQIEEREQRVLRVGAISTSLHVGTHLDAPSHFIRSGASIDQLDLNVFVGPAAVVNVYGVDAIGPEAIPDWTLAAAPRLLLRTDAWADVTRFPTSIPTLTLAAIGRLAAHGIVLVGIDVPSVDAIDSANLPIHHALADRGINILESLCLTDVPDGVYELIAVPLRLVGADASPIRAILRTIEADRRFASN